MAGQIPDILETYNEERRPFGERLVHTTDRAFSMLVSKSPIAQFARTRILPHWLSTVLRFEKLRRLMFKTISQTVIDYRNSSLSDGSGSSSVRSGDRLPWFEWDGGNSFEWLAGGRLCGAAAGRLFRALQSAGLVVVRSHTIDVNGAGCRGWPSAAGLPSRGIVVVRPDMHVGPVIAG